MIGYGLCQAIQDLAIYFVKAFLKIIQVILKGVARNK